MNASASALRASEGGSVGQLQSLRRKRSLVSVSRSEPGQPVPPPRVGAHTPMAKS